MAIGLVVAVPVIGATNYLLVAEWEESFGVGEDVELDGPLELMATLLSGFSLCSAGSLEIISDEPAAIPSVLVASQPQRAPPLRSC